MTAVRRKSEAGKPAGPKKIAKKSAAKKRAGSAPTPSTPKAGGRAKSVPRSGKGAWSNAREEQHRLKQEAIIRVTSRLINRKGYAGMSLADIADKLEIRNASLYYYFDSKEDLVFACFERAQRIVRETLESVYESSGTGLEAIEFYVVTIRERIKEGGELPVAANALSLSHAHMKVILTAELDHIGCVASLIMRGIDDGSIRPCNVPLITTMLFSALRSVPGHYVGVSRADWPELDKEVLAAVRHLLAP